MGCDVGTTGTNLGQLAICSWTFMQEEMCTLILASVTWEERQGRGSGSGGAGAKPQALWRTRKQPASGPALLLLFMAQQQV